MPTLTKDNIGISWVDLVSELNLNVGVSYIVQNTTPYPLEVRESQTPPEISDFGHTLEINSPWVVTITFGCGLYIRNQKKDDKKLGRIVVTESSSIAGPYVNNLGTTGQYPFFIQDIDYSQRNSLNTVFGEKLIGTRVPSTSTQFQYGFPSDFADTTLLNGATALVEDSLSILRTGTDPAGSATIQTKDYLRYIPGHEAYFVFTMALTQGVPDSFQRVGLFDENDGFYVGYEEEDFCVSRKRAGVIEEKIVINPSVVFDPIHGVFDPTKGNVYRISFGYLGFATINFEVMSPCGCWRLLHKFLYPNTSTVTHITQTNLPARAQLTNTGNTTNLEFRSGSLSFGNVDGGGVDATARYFSAGISAVPISAGDFNVVTFRNKDTFQSIENRVKATLMLVSIATDLSRNSSWKIIRNATITNTPTWTDVNTTDSTFEYSTDTTINPVTGDILLPFTMAKNQSFFELVEDAVVQLRPGETASVLVTTPLGTSGNVDAAFRWKELF